MLFFLAPHNSYLSLSNFLCHCSTVCVVLLFMSFSFFVSFVSLFYSLIFVLAILYSLLFLLSLPLNVFFPPTHVDAFTLCSSSFFSSTPRLSTTSGCVYFFLLCSSMLCRGRGNGHVACTLSFVFYAFNSCSTGVCFPASIPTASSSSCV